MILCAAAGEFQAPARVRVECAYRMTAGDDDGALAAAFAARERWAFDDAYGRYAASLYAAAHSILPEPEEARDAVHDALARIWRSPEAYTPRRGSLKSFLTVCVRNEAITRARAQGRRARLASRLAAEPVEHDELHVVDSVENDRLRAALAALAPELRRPLELAYYQYLTHVEIARELKIPLGTIKSRIANGLRKLGATLSGT